MKQITKEILRTEEYKKIESYKRDNLKKNLIINERKIEQYNIILKEKNKLEVILRNFLKTGKMTPSLEFSNKLLINNTYFIQKLLKIIGLKDKKLIRKNTGELPIDQRDLLLTEGVIEIKTKTEYILLERVSNDFDHLSISPPKESYEEFINKIRLLLSKKGYKEMRLPWSVSYEENFSFLKFNRKNLKVITEKDN